MDPPKRVPPKRKRDAEEVREEERRLRPHPYGIRPEGNMFLEAVSNCRNAGLGTLQPISDTLVGEILGYLPAESLCIASTASKSLYAFSHADDLWKPLTLFSLRKDGKYFYDANGWKQTYINTKWKFLGKKGSPPRHSPIRVTNFFSDTLYHPHHDASMRIPPAWTRVNNVDRVSAKTLTKRAFVDTYETPGVPVVIQDLVSEWPSFRKWDWQYLLQFSDAEFQCEAAKLTLEEFKTYSDNQLDDRPLYLFDSKFCDTVPQFKEDYEVPQYFTDDLFKVLGSARPDYRWLIMGPTRSGITTYF
ncbi:F-box protein [Diplonema papillatum]|nr:F-box protein [Diplonema papillatum]